MLIPRSRKSLSLVTHFFLNSISPTEKASSIRSTSGLMSVAIANARRATIPSEYARRGTSAKSSNSENSRIPVNFAAISRLEKPCIEPLKKIFSLPESSGSRPAERPRIAPTFPFTITRPTVGLITPASVFRRVVFPAPLSPITPTISPFSAEKEMPCSACISL